MKYSITLSALLMALNISVSHAGCNTVMGGCERQDAVNAPAHLHADAAKKQAVKDDKETKLSAEAKGKQNTKKL